MLLFFFFSFMLLKKKIFMYSGHTHLKTRNVSQIFAPPNIDEHGVIYQGMSILHLSVFERSCVGSIDCFDCFDTLWTPALTTTDIHMFFFSFAPESVH